MFANADAAPPAETETPQLVEVTPVEQDKANEELEAPLVVEEEPVAPHNAFYDHCPPCGMG